MIDQLNFTADTCNRGDLRFIGEVSRTTKIFPVVSTEYFQNHRKMSISPVCDHRVGFTEKFRDSPGWRAFR